MTGEIRDYQAFPVPFSTGPLVNPISVNGNTGRLNVETWGSLVLIVDITAISGTGPTITVSVDEWDSVSNKFVSVATTVALNAVSTTRLVLNPILGQFIRISWVVAGTTPSITCTMSLKLRAS